MLYVRLLYIMIILALILAVFGCEQPQAMTDLGPQLDHVGQRRSVVMDGPLLDYLKSRQDQPEGYAWYHSRNDQRIGVAAGYELPVIETSTTYTRDYQRGSHGRVYDHFHSTTYRTEHRRSTR